MTRSLPAFAGFPDALDTRVGYGPFRAVAYPDARWDDGDTIPFLFDNQFRNLTFQSGRLLGINAPERRDPGGPEARDYLITRLLPPGMPCLVHTERDPEKYGRWLVVPVTVDADGGFVVVNLAMVHAGHATFDYHSDDGNAFRRLSGISERYHALNLRKDASP